MELLSWSKVSTTVEFYEERGPIGTGGFRKAFKATSKHAEFINKKWVIKHYLPDALKCIAETRQTAEQHNRKVVQMHLLAKNFASQLDAEVKSNESSDLFGTTFRYTPGCIPCTSHAEDTPRVSKFHAKRPPKRLSQENVMPTFCRL